MHRRNLLKLGIASAALLTLAGGVAVMLQPGLQGGKLTPAGHAMFASVGRAILQGTLPAEPQAAAQALPKGLRMQIEFAPASGLGGTLTRQVQLVFSP